MNRRESIKTTSTMLAATLLGGHVSAKSMKNISDETQNNIWNVFEDRRSVRKFKSDAIPEEHVQKMLHAAHLAPCAGNFQPWKFLVIKNMEKINELGETTLNNWIENYTSKNNPNEAELQEKTNYFKERIFSYLSAPLYVQILIDYKPNLKNYYQKDGSLAAGQLMLAARALGYGSVFITDSFNYETIKQVFNIPDNYKGVCFIPIGVPEAWPSVPPKKELSELIISESF